MGCNKNLTDDQLETQMQEVYQIFFKRSGAQATPL